MSINNLLFTVQNMAPAMLGIGAGKTQNYSQLAEMTGLLGDDAGTSSLTGSDTVSLTYKNIGQQIVTDMAGVTAQTIKEYPELDKDYVIALVDDGVNREARVYRRSEILDNFEGTAEEKEALKKQLDSNPLMVFNNASGLPETASDKASQALASGLNSFLKTNAKTINVLDKAGYDPFANLLGSANQKKILTNYAVPTDSKNNKQAAQSLMSDLTKVIEDAVKEKKELDKDYVIAIVDDGAKREARVYRRSDILDHFTGTEAEKEALKKQLDERPFMVFDNASGLPATASDGASQLLADKLNTFLTDQGKTLDALDKAGADPLANYLTTSTQKKMLFNYGEALAAA